MKIFQTIQKIFNSIGIYADRISFGHYEWRHVIGYIIYAMLSFLYVAIMPATTMEYIESISNMTVIAIVMLGYLSFRFSTRVLFKIIDDLEHAINRSE